MKRKRQVGRFLQADPEGPVQTDIPATGTVGLMKESLLEVRKPSWQTSRHRPLPLDRDACEELARVLGGIGAPTEFRALAARLAAASEDLGGNAWVR